MVNSAEKQAFLIVTHQMTKHVLRLYHKIKKATSDLGDVFILYHVKNGMVPVEHEGVNIETFTDEIMTSLHYRPIRTSLVPGSNHFPVLGFFLKHSEYSQYWCIEDDVAFTGNWNYLFQNVSESGNYDFISSHVRRYSDLPDWYWWDTFRAPGPEIETDKLVNSFNPIYRISNKALQHLDTCLKNGFRGHHEVVIPTLLHMAGFSIADFSTVENHFTPHLSFCTLRTMRWKPVFFVSGNKRNKLYHPVKAKMTVKQALIYVKRTLQNRKEYFS